MFPYNAPMTERRRSRRMDQFYVLQGLLVLVVLWIGLEAGYRIGSHAQYHRDQVSAAKMTDALTATFKHVYEAR